jgi:hypothetical protein
MNDPVALLREVRACLAGYRFHFACERDLQEGISQALQMTHWSVQREYPLTRESRLDFLVEGGIVIEVKIASSAAEVMRQVARYAEHEKVAGVLLITSRAHRLPETFSGKPLLLHHLTESAF